MEGLGQRLTSVKTYLQSQIKALSSKQDQTMAAQAAMQEHLAHVGADVESTRIEVSEVSPAVDISICRLHCRLHSSESWALGALRAVGVQRPWQDRKHS